MSSEGLSSPGHGKKSGVSIKSLFQAVFVSCKMMKTLHHTSHPFSKDRLWSVGSYLPSTCGLINHYFLISDVQYLLTEQAGDG